jgi:hypothetical protein
MSEITNNRLIKMIGEPKKFSGNAKDEQSLTVEAHAWLQRMTRFKKTAKFNDEEMLFVVGEYLVEKAQRWWTVYERKIKKWDEFMTAFNKQYLANMEESYWVRLQELKQNDNDTVDDIALQMEELFALLNIDNNTFQVRSFLGAIKPTIAYEVERENPPKTFELAKERAKTIEKNFIRYHIGYRSDNSALPVSSDNLSNPNDSTVSDGWRTAASNLESMADRLERMHINLVEATKWQGQNRYRNKENPNSQGNIVCYKCQEPGHKSYQCTKETNRPPATGSNTVPLSPKKENEQY